MMFSPSEKTHLVSSPTSTASLSTSSSSGRSRSCGMSRHNSSDSSTIDWEAFFVDGGGSSSSNTDTHCSSGGGAAAAGWTRSRRVKAALVGLSIVVGGLMLMNAVPSKRNEEPSSWERYHLHKVPDGESKNGGDGGDDDYFPLLHLEGKKHKKSNKNKNDVEHSACMDGTYSKHTLKLAYEVPFQGLFSNPKGQKSYEASGVTLMNGKAYAICDNSWAISKFEPSLHPFSDENVQIGDPNREAGIDSGYEAIFHDGLGHVYVVRESVHHADDDYHSIIEQIELLTTNDANNETVDDDYRVVEACSSEFKFEGASKGFEGAVGVHSSANDNELVVLGLCEGNYCSEKRKFERGNGRIVAMRKEVVDGTCQWSTIRTIDIPSSANFNDYSSMALNVRTGRVAIATQEDSKLWVGQLEGLKDGATSSTGQPLWDIDAMKFDTKNYRVYDFPKNDQCQTKYCNIEGVHWINDDMIVAVSDRMKSRGKQDFRCFDKDESLHVFVLP